MERSENHGHGEDGRKRNRRRPSATDGRRAERWVIGARLLIGLLHLVATIVWHGGCS